MDPIQRTSSTPLPPAQTERSARDPLPIGARKDIGRADDEAKGKTEMAGRDAFEDYLDQSSVLMLEKNQRSAHFDPAAEIVDGSVYKPNGGTPL